MSWRINIHTGAPDYYEKAFDTATINEKIIKYTVENYSALLLVVGMVEGEFAYVKDSQGTKWLPGTLGGTYYPKGYYYFNGASWDNDLTDIAEELNNINSTISTKGDMFKSTYDVDNTGVVDNAEAIQIIGRNSTGSTLYKGTIIYINGSTGNRPNFAKAKADSETTSAGTFGVIASDLANNSDGYALCLGYLDNLDTRAVATHPFTTDTLVDGDTIYLSPTAAGYVTNVKPSAPNHLVYLGKVTRTSPTNGTIVYRIQNGYELDELHDVAISGLANNDALLYESSTQLYKNKPLTKSLVGLSNVDNTSDLDKPVSTAVQTALNLKLNTDSSIDTLNDVTITTPVTNQLLQWNGSQWVNSSGAAISAGPGVVYFLTNTSAGFGSYEYMSKAPDSLAEVEETVIINSNTVLIHEYISDNTIGKTTIDAGIWEFNFFSYVTALTASFVVNVYKRTSGGVETLLFSIETDLINWTTPNLSNSTTVQQGFLCNTTDNLVIKIYGKTTQTTDVTLKLVHSGTEHYSHLHVPLILAHNDIAGLQGGATGEYYHLNSTVNTKLLSWNTSGLPDSDIQSAATWNAASTAISGLVPYTGATADVNLGARNIASNSETVNYTDLLSQGSIPAVPPNATDLRLFSNVGHLSWRRGSSGYTRTLSATLTASRTWTLQDRAGTLADDTDLALKANIASPTFTGTPLSTTATSGTNTTQIATTAFVQDALNKQKEVIQLAVSDETTALTVGSNKIIFRMPYAMTLTEVRASLSTAQTSGSILTVDINESGTSVISTKLTIDNTEKTSVTAATPAVVSDASLADDAEISIDIDQVGDGTAKGLKITLIGTRT